jgi:hypothetical protein
VHMCSTQLHASSNFSIPLRKLRLAKLVKKSQGRLDSKRFNNYTIQVHSPNFCFKINFNIILPSIGCSNKSARFTRVINAAFIQKVPIFSFQYKAHTLRLFVERNIRQTSPTTQHGRGGRQCPHFKSCALVGTPHIRASPKCYHVFGLLIENQYSFRIIQMRIYVPPI